MPVAFKASAHAVPHDPLSLAGLLRTIARPAGA
jgi:hypothetical protein